MQGWKWITVYLPTNMHYARVTCLQVKNIHHTPTGQFLRSDLQFQTTYLLTINMKNGIQFLPK